MVRGGQGCDQMDAPELSVVRRQRCSTSASCAGLQSWKFPAHAGDAGPDQGLIDDDSQGEIHQDRREGRKSWPLRRLPDGRGRHSQKLVRRPPPAHRGVATAASHLNRIIPNLKVRDSVAVTESATI